MGQQGNVNNIKLGPADVTFDGTALGLTKGGVIVSITQSVIDVVIDNWGDTPINAFDKGASVSVTVPMVEDTLEKIGIAIPSGTVTSDRIKIGSPAGTVISTGKLIINPNNTEGS